MLVRAVAVAVAALAAITPAAQAVIGGRPATRPYPFMVSLQDADGHFCGGSLLAPDRVLTAAHCVEGMSADRVTAVIGRTRLASGGGEAIAVAEITVHEAYVGQSHDVALLRLAHASTQATVRIAGPAERGLWEPRDTVRVIGWGTSFFLVGAPQDQLMEVDVPIVSEDDCERTNGPIDRTTVVCAGEEEGFKDACQGDSGGPLLAFAGDEPVQVGSVSSGLGCGLPMFYGLYARVADPKLRDWIAARLPGGPAAAPQPAPPATPRSPVRLTFARDLGAARLARRRGAVRLRIRASAPVTRLLAVLRRGNRVVARARTSRVSTRRVLAIRLPARALRSGTLRVALSATDASGRRVSRSGTARLRR